MSGTEKERFSGDKRGEALVQLVRHKDGTVLGQHRYNGGKESERPCMREGRAEVAYYMMNSKAASG